jgi:hypothetical protein
VPNSLRNHTFLISPGRKGKGAHGHFGKQITCLTDPDLAPLVRRQKMRTHHPQRAVLFREPLAVGLYIDHRYGPAELKL